MKLICQNCNKKGSYNITTCSTNYRISKNGDIFINVFCNKCNYINDTFLSVYNLIRDKKEKFLTCAEEYFKNLLQNSTPSKPVFKRYLEEWMNGITYLQSAGFED